VGYEGVSITVSPYEESAYTPILDGLKEFNRGVIGEIGNDRLVVVAKDEAGATVGGSFGALHLGWLRVDVLWVAESYRGKGLGSAILAEIEREGLARGASRAMLDTFQFQAPEFYKRCGYVEYGRIKDFVQGYDRLYLEKKLA